MSYGELPAYQVIAAELRERIRTGDLAPGTALPRQVELAEQHGVSLAVTRQAFSMLIAEGLAEGRPGAGTYVRERPQVLRLLRGPRPEVGRGSPFRAEMADRYGAIGDWLHESVTTAADEQVAERLAIEAGDRVVRTVYTYRADREPVMLATSWEPMAITGARRSSCRRPVRTRARAWSTAWPRSGWRSSRRPRWSGRARRPRTRRRGCVSRSARWR